MYVMGRAKLQHFVSLESPPHSAGTVSVGFRHVVIRFGRSDVTSNRRTRYPVFRHKQVFGGFGQSRGRTYGGFVLPVHFVPDCYYGGKYVQVYMELCLPTFSLLTIFGGTCTSQASQCLLRVHFC